MVRECVPDPPRVLPRARSRLFAGVHPRDHDRCHRTGHARAVGTMDAQLSADGRTAGRYRRRGATSDGARLHRARRRLGANLVRRCRVAGRRSVIGSARDGGAGIGGRGTGGARPLRRARHARRDHAGPRIARGRDHLVHRLSGHHPRAVLGRRRRKREAAPREPARERSRAAADLAGHRPGARDRAGTDSLRARE